MLIGVWLSGRLVTAGAHWTKLSALRALSAIVALVVLGFSISACGSAPQLYDPVLQLSPFLAGDAETVGWSGDGKYLAGGFINNQVHIWQMPDGREVSALSDFGGDIPQLVWSPRKPQLAAISNQPHDGLRIWEPLTGHVAATLSGATSPYTVAWSPDDTLLAVADEPGVELYDTSQWRPIQSFRYTEATPALAWSPDGRTLAVGRARHIGMGNVDLWDVRTAKLIQTIPWPDRPSRLRWSPDGRFLAARGSGDAVQIWDITNQRVTATLPHDQIVEDIDWAPDGQRLLVVNEDSLKIWAPGTWSLLTTIPYTHNAAAGRWSPDGAYFAIAGLLGEVTVYKAK